MTEDQLNEQRDKSLATARQWMTRNALTLQQRLDPIDSAGILIGAAIGVLLSTVGKAKAVEYLLNIAADLDEQPAASDQQN